MEIFPLIWVCSAFVIIEKNINVKFPCLTDAFQTKLLALFIKIFRIFHLLLVSHYQHPTIVVVMRLKRQASGKLSVLALTCQILPTADRPKTLNAVVNNIVVHR